MCPIFSEFPRFGNICPQRASMVSAASLGHKAGSFSITVQFPFYQQVYTKVNSQGLTGPQPGVDRFVLKGWQSYILPRLYSFQDTVTIQVDQTNHQCQCNGGSLQPGGTSSSKVRMHYFIFMGSAGCATCL